MTRAATALGPRALLLGLALLTGAPALAGDVSVRLDSGAGFSVKDSTGTIERLRVDEATGNLSRNGALFVHTTGANNIFVGVNAGNTTTTGSHISAFGTNALVSNTTGTLNSAVGSNALRHNSTGRLNSALGYGALYYNTSGNGNTGVGFRVLFSNTTGELNSAVGEGALFYNTTGQRNVALGYESGSNQSTGSDNIYLANRGVAAESNTIRIGTPGTGIGTHAKAFIAGIRGVTTGMANAVNVVIDSNGQLGTVSSSRSVKNDIRDMGDATDRLLDLRPVMFRYKQQQTLPSGGEAPPEYGLIAEEVAEVFPDLVVYDEQGQPFTVKYHEMAPMLLNEMKKQQHTIEGQQQTIEGQQHVIVELSSRLAIIEGKIGSAARLRQ